MLRLSYFGALLGIALSLSAPAASQKNSQQNVKPGAQSASASRVEHVVVRGAGDAMEVEIQTSGVPVALDAQAITGPDRIVVDFPGALPASELRALQVNRGALKRVRAGLFFSNPPITRVVLDLAEPQSYRISTVQNGVVIKLGPGTTGSANVLAGNADPVGDSVAKPKNLRPQKALLQNALLRNASPAPVAGKVTAEKVSVSSSSSQPAPTEVTAREPVSASSVPAPASTAPAQPHVTVTYASGMLSIRSEKATLAEVLFEVQRQTQADIAIPAGAELEEVVADIGPAPARDALAALLNGSKYNFIFVGDGAALERVILTLHDTGN
jgi:hypothetical protein